MLDEAEAAPIVTRRRLRVAGLRALLALVVLGALLTALVQMTTVPTLPPGVLPHLAALCLLIALASTAPLSLVEAWLVAGGQRSFGWAMCATGLVAGATWAGVAAAPFMLGYAQGMLATRDVGLAADGVLRGAALIGAEALAPWLGLSLWAGVAAGITLLLRLELDGGRLAAIGAWLGALALALLGVQPCLAVGAAASAGAAAVAGWGLCWVAGTLDVLIFGYPDTRAAPDGL